MHAPAKAINRTDITPSIAIIGGGVSGAAVAIHLNRLFTNAVRLIVFEPRADIGRGLAYSTPDPVHKINVPASRMELYPDDGEHFSRWFASSGRRSSDTTGYDFDPSTFSTRLVFGDYVNQQVEGIEGLTHIRSRAMSVERVGAKFDIKSEDGQIVTADAIVLATGHSSPTLPASFVKAASECERIVSDPWRSNTLGSIEPDDRILIVGTGLTMADLVASLEDRGHRGKILAVSRRGQRSRSHALRTTDPYGDFISEPIRTALRLLTQIRAIVMEARSEGISWHAVLDQVRYQAPRIWQNLPSSEKHKVLRHLRPFWDTHRFRLAPQVSDALKTMLARGQFDIKAASIQDVAVEGNQISISFRKGHVTNVHQVKFDRVIIATGANYRDIFRTDPLLSHLYEKGLAKPDRYGLGIEVDNDSRVVDLKNEAQQRIFVAGPAARGTFGELMGITEISKQALHVAVEIAATLRLPAQSISAL